jgi:hypothetical protein
VTNPITPPPDLVQQWLCSHDFVWGPLEEPSITIMATRLQNVATQAARWGANQELEACCEWTAIVGGADALRAARRPNPPSLKEQALEQLACIQTDLNKFGMGISTNTIRTALEALDD